MRERAILEYRELSLVSVSDKYGEWLVGCLRSLVYLHGEAYVSIVVEWRVMREESQRNTHAVLVGHFEEERKSTVQSANRSLWWRELKLRRKRAGGQKLEKETKSSWWGRGRVAAGKKTPADLLRIVMRESWLPPVSIQLLICDDHASASKTQPHGKSPSLLPLFSFSVSSLLLIKMLVLPI